MTSSNTPHPRRARSPQSQDDTSEESGLGICHAVVTLMILAAIAVVAIGWVRKGFDLGVILTSVTSLVTGIGFAAIGLLELEWLERVIGFVDGIFCGIGQWLWTSWHGTLSDSEVPGRRVAAFIWLVCGIPVYIVGVLLALRVIGL